jgi:hypothetical protein
VQAGEDDDISKGEEEKGTHSEKTAITRGFGWHIHCSVEVTELNLVPINNTLSIQLYPDRA